jgi:hypothetical protein
LHCSHEGLHAQSPPPYYKVSSTKLKPSTMVLVSPGFCRKRGLPFTEKDLNVNGLNTNYNRCLQGNWLSYVGDSIFKVAVSQRYILHTSAPTCIPPGGCANVPPKTRWVRATKYVALTGYNWHCFLQQLIDACPKARFSPLWQFGQILCIPSMHYRMLQHSTPAIRGIIIVEKLGHYRNTTV